MKKLKIFTIIFCTFLLVSCYAKEFLLVDPVFNIQNYGIRKVLFLGFENHYKTEAPTKIKTRLENSLFDKFKKLDLVDIVKIDKDEALLYPTYTEKDFITLAKKYDTNIIVIGYIEDYKELKYIDQPLTKFTDNNYNSLGLSDPNVKNLVRYDISLSGKFNIINSNADILWTHKINDVKSIQFETTPNDLSTENEVNVYAKVRESLIESVSDDIIKDLIPYYSYKY